MKILIPMAYLNLGSGSYFVQLLIASILGMLVISKVYWKSVLDFLKKFTGKNKKR